MVHSVRPQRIIIDVPLNAPWTQRESGGAAVGEAGDLTVCRRL